MSISVAKTVRVASAVALALSASWAVAQSQGAEGGLEEIVVTAQKRVATAQEVPISIVAVTGEQLARTGQTDF